MSSRTEREKAIEAAIFSGLLLDGHKKTPGRAISRLPQSIRDILQECTSDDWNRVLEVRRLLGRD